MVSDKPLGGFFELELPDVQLSIHQGAIALSTGRSCLEAILRSMKPKRCFLPHYTCRATIDPFEKLGIDVVFYEITDRFKPCLPDEIKGMKKNRNEMLLATNHWGLQRDQMRALAEEFEDQLIVDNTHDFFSDGLKESWCFTSARKYFGIPDGAFLFAPETYDHATVVPESTPRFSNISLQHSIGRTLGDQASAFKAYQEYEGKFECRIERISKYSEMVLSLIDFELVSQTRRQNFALLERGLADRNDLELSCTKDSIPFVYPFLPQSYVAKAEFYKKNIFPPVYWPDILNRKNVTCANTIKFCRELIPLPIDHRYGESEMKRIIEVLSDLEV